jgi:putative peptide zinc metalloprotease protein
MQSLISEHWHAVRTLRPRLREGVTALHRRLRGRPWVLLYDPVAQRFHRVPAHVYKVITLLDGVRTLDEIWAAACAEAESQGSGNRGVIGQHDLVQLMSQLYSNDLLQTQISPDASEVLARYKKQKRSKLMQSWLNPISMKVPLVYPDPWFDRQRALAEKLFSQPVLWLWLVIVTPAAVLAWQNWQPLTTNLSDRVLSAQNLFLLWFTYPVVKGIHEWAHGMAIKAWGGAVREMGVMLIVFAPVPYVDASASYRFPSKWTRATVAAAGILAELLLGAIAVYVWLAAEPGLVKALAYNVILIAGASTVLVNGNPLMRYDGYFILCDLLETPNLAQRATQYWVYLSDRYFFRSLDAKPPMESEGERPLLFFYGAIAPFYRLFITFGLIWFVATQYFIVGVILALISTWMAVVLPLWKAYKHVNQGGTLSRRRDFSQRRAVLAIGLFAGLLFVVPMPFYSVQQAVVWLPEDNIIRAQVAGLIAERSVQQGQRVTRGQPLLRLDNLELSAEAETAAASVEKMEAQLRSAEGEDLVKAEGLRQELGAARARVSELESRLKALNITAPSKGVWVQAADTELQGRYAKRGEVLGYVVDGPSQLLRAAVTQEDMAIIKDRLRAVEARLSQNVYQPITGHVVRRVPGGDETLISAALGSNGGGAIPVDPAQAEGTQSLQKVFDLEIALERPSPTNVFGDRASVRFDLGWAPLGWQWFLRIRQLFLSHLNV